MRFAASPRDSRSSGTPFSRTISFVFQPQMSPRNRAFLDGRYE